MPWDGSGTFNLVYNWPTDAANGLPISSSRMQGQEQDIATGLMNCLTLDGQTTPTANIGWGGFKIQNLGTPVAGTDAATKAYADGVVTSIPAPSQGFQPVPYTVVFNSANSIKTVGVDSRTFFSIGRKLLITDHGGSTTAAFVVVATAFTTDTVITLASAGALSFCPTIVSPVTVVLAAPSVTTVGINSNTANSTSLSNGRRAFAANGNAASSAVLAATAFTTGDLYQDVPGNTWFPKFAANYLILSVLNLSRNSATISSPNPWNILLHDSGGGDSILFSGFYLPSTTGWTSQILTFANVLFVTTSFTYTVRYDGSSVPFTGGPPSWSLTFYAFPL